MTILCGLILLTGAYPFWRAWQANRRTSLVYAVLWAAAAWAAWTASLWVAALRDWGETATIRYVAFCLTGCAAVAVLGARRPGAGPWNFVVLGLLAVLLLPVAYGLGRPRPELAHTIFLAGTVAIGVLNYLPTRLPPAGALVAVGCAVETMGWLDPQRWGGDPVLPAGPFLTGLAPWVVYLQFAGWTKPPNEFDRLWLWFRNRFGLVWSQRVREQFNRSAANAGWPVYLRWGGLRRQPGSEMPDPADQEQIVLTLRALLKRFEEVTDVETETSNPGPAAPQ
jgi:hypothetical protein